MLFICVRLCGFSVLFVILNVRFTAGTLGDWIKYFQQAWKTDSARPKAAVIDDILDWTTYYRGRINHIKGFVKTSKNKGIVRVKKIQLFVCYSCVYLLHEIQYNVLLYMFIYNI